MRRIVLSLALGAMSAIPMAAQPLTVGTGTELRSFVGAFVPTGGQKREFKAATMVGVQAAQELSSNWHVLGSLSYTHGHNKFALFTDDRTAIWQYDVGIEANAVVELANKWLWRPLVGIGAGGRTYDYRNPNVGSNSCTAGYGSVGTEFQRNIVAIRFEARDYVNCFESPMSGKKSTRNDLGLSIGLAYHIR
jgi:hypothetical protein